MPTVIETLLRPLSRQEENEAAAALGVEHPLVRGVALRRAIALQLIVTLMPIAFGIMGTLRHVDKAPFVLGAACLVELLLVAGILFVRSLTRERARALVAEGRERLPLRAIRDERRILASPKERARLARALERHLLDAERWDAMIPQSRPLAGVRKLRFARREAIEVASRLRSPSASVRGVAAVFQLLTDGHSSSLFAGEVEDLRADLIRIGDLLVRAESDKRAAA